MTKESRKVNLMMFFLHNKSLGENGYSLLILITFCFAFFMASQLPIYPDEVAYRILLERFFLSGGYKTSLTPYCAEGFQVVPPHLLKISAFFWSCLSHINSTTTYRFLPETLLLVSVGSLYWFVSKYGKVTNSWFLGLFLLGVSIYGLVILRPEIIIAMALVLLTISGLYISRIESPRPNVSLSIAILITLLFILVSYVHPKALYLILPTLVVLGLIVEKVFHSPVRVVFLGIMIYIVLLTTYDSVHIHQLGYTSCDAFPEVEKVIKSMSVNILDLFHAPTKFMTDLVMVNDRSQYIRVMSQVGFQSQYDANVFPGTAVSFLTESVNLLIYFILILTFLYVGFIIIYNLVSSFRSRSFKREFLLYLAISAVIGSHFFLNAAKNWYDMSLSVFSLGFLAFIGSNLKGLDTNIIKVNIAFVAKYLQPLIAIAAVLSLVINYQDIYTKFVEGYVGPGLSINLNLSSLKKFAQTEFKQDYEGTTTPIILDDLTYHMFQKHTQVYPISYLLMNAKKNQDTITPILHGHHLIGITQCSSKDVFDAVRKTTLLTKKNFTIDKSLVFEVCKWEVR